MTHIENSDRGITLSKSLAWTVLVFVAGGGFWVGVALSDLTSQSKTTADAVSGLQQTLGDERRGTDQGRIGERVATMESNMAHVLATLPEWTE